MIAGRSKDENELWTVEQVQSAIEQELQNERSAKEISVALAKRSGWNKREIYSLINQKK